MLLIFVDHILWIGNKLVYMNVQYWSYTQYSIYQYTQYLVKIGTLILLPPDGIDVSLLFGTATRSAVPLPAVWVLEAMEIHGMARYWIPDMSDTLH